jgi:N-methylhydantoinase A
MSYYVGTDIGGTFTDLVLLDEVGEVTIVKAPTTPENRTQGVLDAFHLAAEREGILTEALIERLAYFAHGTTAATNAFIERKGVRTGLLTTRGFRDTLRVQRCMASWVGLMDHEIAHFSTRSVPTPIIDIDDTVEIDERIDYKGAVIAPLDEKKARESIRRLIEQGVEAIAIALLWSFRNPVHEQRLAEIIKEMAPNIFVTTSSALIPILGEYERTSTTAINSYLGPVINRYISNLEGAIRDFGFDGPISIMESGGGVLPASEAAFQAANLLTSGPAGGVLASQKLGDQLGYANILTTDMGGTSFDVGVIVNGEPLLETVREVGRFHVALPSIKVTAIGAGGGSIARIQAGHLAVGPESAGSVPGPACYGRGGTEPTITDADVVLGIIDPAYFLGGKWSLDIAASERAIATHIAKPLGISLHEAAAGIREVANNKMADLLRRVTTRAGYDPRQFVVFAYGGAGPTHAYHYSSVAGISTVVVPITASGHSAFGTVTADRHRSFSLAFGGHAPARFTLASDHIDIARFNASLTQLENKCRDTLGPTAEIRRLVGMRFRQQVHQIAIDIPPGAVTAETIDALVDTFEQRYEAIYGKGTALRLSGVEFTTLRVEGILPVVKPVRRARAKVSHRAVSIAKRRVYFYGRGFRETGVYRWEDLGVGHEIIGPAIVERPDTTIVVGPDQHAAIEPYGNLVIQIEQ